MFVLNWPDDRHRGLKYVPTLDYIAIVIVQTQVNVES